MVRPDERNDDDDDDDGEKSAWLTRVCRYDIGEDGATDDRRAKLITNRLIHITPYALHSLI